MESICCGGSMVDRTRFLRGQEEVGSKQCGAKYGLLMAAPASPGRLTEMQMLRPSLKPTHSESLPGRAWNLCNNTLLTWFLCTLNCENLSVQSTRRGVSLVKEEAMKQKIYWSSEVKVCGEMRQGRFHQKTFTFYWHRAKRSPAERMLCALGPSAVMSPTVSLCNLYSSRHHLPNATGTFLTFLSHLTGLPTPLNVLRSPLPTNPPWIGVAFS